MASHMLAGGVPLPAVSARLSHSDMHTTLRIYGHMIHGQDDDAAQVGRLPAEEPPAGSADEKRAISRGRCLRPNFPERNFGNTFSGQLLRVVRRPVCPHLDVVGSLGAIIERILLELFRWKEEARITVAGKLLVRESTAPAERTNS